MVCACYSVMLVVLQYTTPLCSDILVTYLIWHASSASFQLLHWQFIQTHSLNEAFLGWPLPALSSLALPDLLVLRQKACCHAICPIFRQWLIVANVLNYHLLPPRNNRAPSRSWVIVFFLWTSFYVWYHAGYTTNAQEKWMLNESRLKQITNG